MIQATSPLKSFVGFGMTAVFESDDGATKSWSARVERPSLQDVEHGQIDSGRRATCEDFTAR
jgi:hypothetical protein